MRPVLATFLAGLVLAAPQVALAQFVPRSPAPAPSTQIVIRPVDVPVGPDLIELRRTIEDGRDTGMLDRKTARELRREVRLLEDTAERYARDGLSADESRELQSRAIIARQQAALQRGVIDSGKR